MPAIACNCAACWRGSPGCALRRHARAASWEARPRGEVFGFERAGKLYSPRVAPPTRKACQLHKVTPRTGCFRGSPALGAKLLVLGGPASCIRRGSRPPQEKRASCIRGRHARAASWEPRPRGEASGSERAGKLYSPRVAPPTRKAGQLHKGTPRTGCLWEPRPRGEASGFERAGKLYSPRVAPPTRKACHLHKVAPRTDCFRRSPDPGAKLLAFCRLTGSSSLPGSIQRLVKLAAVGRYQRVIAAQQVEYLQQRLVWQPVGVAPVAYEQLE